MLQHDANIKNSETTTDGYITDKKVDLTPDQRRAVYYGDGPLMIVAGAGTGKTTCLAHRVANLIASKKAKMDELLVLTFSHKAAAEMEERVDLILPYAFSDVQISTFHSFGQKILQRHAIEVGIYPDFRVLTPGELLLFLKECLFELPLEIYRPLSNPTFHLKAIAALISRLKDEDISPDEYLAFANSIEVPSGDEAAADKKAIHREMALVYRAIQSLMFEKGFIDMADLVYLPLQLLRQRPLIAEEYRKQYKYILIDEFQDTNYSQYQLLKLLSAGYNNLTVVGDDDQSIYKFRGAAISNILSFIEDYPNAGQVVLNRNFRSPRRILEASYRLIIHNNPYRLEVKNDIDKKLIGREDPGAVLAHRVYDTLESMAGAASEIVTKKVEEGYSFSDILILVRANKHAEPIIREFNVQGIPFVFSGNSGLYSRPEIRTVINFFRTVVRPDDSLGLYFLSASEVYELDAPTLTRLSLFSDHANLPLEEVFRGTVAGEIKQLESLPPKSVNMIKRILRDLDKFRGASTTLTAGRLLYEFLAGTSYLGRLARREINNAEMKTRNIALFFEIIKQFEGISDYPYAMPFINHLDDLIRAGDDPPSVKEEVEIDSVSIMTVHKAKGLEFPVVIIAGLAEGAFPSRRQSRTLDVPDELIRERMISPDFHYQEERRLFYVAMTRSQKELYLLGSRNFGGKRSRKISRFLMEALDMPMKNVRVKVTPPGQAIEQFAPKEKSLERLQETSPVGGLNSLKPMQLDDYITCPLKYKFVHVQKIPVLMHHRVIYGKAVREAVRDFLRRKTSDVPVDAKDVKKVFEREWSQEGFLTRAHEEMRHEEGVESLENFYYKFKNKIGNEDKADRKYRFFIGDAKISGRWDLIHPQPEGDVIINFKSSDARDRKTANRKTRDSLKNKIEILAYLETYKKLPLRLDSYFINSGVTGQTKPREDKIPNFKKKLAAAIEGINLGDYTPLPEPHKCSYCAFVEICPATEREL